MSKTHHLVLLTASALAALAATASAQTVIVSDDSNVTNNASGFALNEGANSVINPPAFTRFTGSAASNLRYVPTATGRTAASYIIANDRLRVSSGTGIGRFTLSANGVSPYNFAPDLGTAGATPADPAVYEIRIALRNDATSTARFSFGLGTSEGDVTTWDFGIQMYRPASTDDYYTIQRRIDTASSGVADINLVMTTTDPGTVNTLNAFLIRVTDAGAVSSAYSSRVQVSLDNGINWVYDSSTDASLLNGWRLDGPGRYFIWDQAGNSSGHVFYDDFSVVSVYAPPPPPERVWTGAGLDDNWSTGGNWGGTAPTSGEPLLFGLSARQANFNDLSLTVPTLVFTNGGFVLNGTQLAISGSVNNLAGNNSIALPLDWPLTGGKSWQVAAGTELTLSGASAVATTGDHVLFGGGTLRLTGSLDINQNPVFIVSEGRFVLDAGVFNSLGGFRIGSSAGAVAPVEVVVSNNASLTLEVPAANLRVGDGAAAVVSRLVVNNGSVTMFGGALGIPFAAGCTGEVIQTGGLVKDCIVAFSDSGAGVGIYSITNGTLEPFQIRKDNPAGTATIRFQNAILRPALGANSDFMRGLEVAEIHTGGLTIDATTPVIIGQSLSGAGGITKVSFETVSLTGTNTYAGNTVVQEGKLVLPTVQTNAAGVQVASGAELGVIRIAPDASLTAGSLSVGTSTLSFDLAALPNPTTPLIAVTSLTAGGGAGSVTVNINGGLGLTAGQFTVVDYSGVIGGGGFNAFTLGTLPPGVSATLVNNAANSSIDLNITSAPGLRWTGANGSSWDYATVNWFDEGANAAGIFSDGQPVRFQDGAATGIVDLTSTFSPSGLTVSNNSLAYVFGGFGSLNVPRLTKTGAGSLTRVDGGTDLIPEMELNAGRFVSSNTFDASLASVLTDASAGLGIFVKSGAGVLTVASNNATFEGGMLVQEGALKVANTAALGSTNGSTIITNGGTLDVNDLFLSDEPILVAGAGVGGQGAIIDSTTATAVQPSLKDVTLTDHATFGSPNGGHWDIRVRANTGPGPGLRGNGFNLTKVGPGFLSIASQRNLGEATPYWEMNLGDVFVEAGTLALAEALTLGNPAKLVAVSPDAVLQLFDLGLTNPILRSIALTNAQVTSGGNATDTNVINGTIALTGDNRIRLDQAVLILNGSLVGSGSLNISANEPGCIYLNGNSTFGGDITVTNGTLGGTGALAGNLIMLGGTNAPGMGIGTLTVNGNVTLGGTTLMEIDHAQSPNSDRLVVGGDLIFGGDLVVTPPPGAAAPQSGDVYQLFSRGGSSGFATMALPNLSGGLMWNTDELLIAGRISVVGGVSSPSIQTPQISGGNLVLAGSGGPANGSFAILSSANVAAPLVEWVTNIVGTFTETGAFSNAIPLTPGEPKRFFLLKQP